ncbi:hypothetical protein [Brasilonema sennae]|uniref:hypothetical protein n=1 Tax=Brasilonema sennae TaxID=1397703 RepID=UPI00155A8982|nr:hypothetical protein [Brasilonema sennae]
MRNRKGSTFIVNLCKDDTPEEPPLRGDRACRAVRGSHPLVMPHSHERSLLLRLLFLSYLD